MREHILVLFLRLEPAPPLNVKVGRFPLRPPPLKPRLPSVRYTSYLNCCDATLKNV